MVASARLLVLRLDKADVQHILHRQDVQVRGMQQRIRLLLLAARSCCRLMWCCPRPPHVLMLTASQRLCSLLQEREAERLRRLGSANLAAAAIEASHWRVKAAASGRLLASAFVLHDLGAGTAGAEQRSAPGRFSSAVTTAVATPRRDPCQQQAPLPAQLSGPAAGSPRSSQVSWAVVLCNHLQQSCCLHAQQATRRHCRFGACRRMLLSIC